MISYLIDTDWIIDFLKGERKVIAKLKSLADRGLAISIISLAEPYEGVYASANPQKHLKSLTDFLTGVTVLRIDDGICRVFGKQRLILRKAGKLIDNFDLLIAATCLHYKLTLMTDNVAHFKRIKGLRIGKTGTGD